MDNVIISKMADEIYKSAKDRSTIRGIEILWKNLRHDLNSFGKAVGNLIKKNRLSLSSDKGWLLKFLRDLTGENWSLTGHDFRVANKK